MVEWRAAAARAELYLPHSEVTWHAREGKTAAVRNTGLVGALLANATRAVLGTVRRSAVLNTRHSVRSVPGRSVVVYEVARGFSGGQEFATSINVANEDSVTLRALLN